MSLAEALRPARALGLARLDAYNFPQGRLTDHRINLTLYKLSQIMEGELDDVLQALHNAREAEQLQALGLDGPT